MEIFRHRLNTFIKDRTIRQFTTDISVESFHLYMLQSKSSREFSTSLSDVFQQHVDNFLALYTDANKEGKENLLQSVTQELTPWQQGKLISLLYLYGHGWGRAEWLPSMAENLYDSLPDSNAKRSFNRALRTTDKANITIHKSGPVISIKRFYSPILKEDFSFTTLT